MSTENTPETSKYEEMDIETQITEKSKVQHGSLIHTNPIPNLDPNMYEYRHTNVQNPNIFRNITNINSPRSFARLNADRIRTITTSNDLACDNINMINCNNGYNGNHGNNGNNDNHGNPSNNGNHGNTLIAPKEVLANALADHIYKVTNQKPSTSRIDEILTNKVLNKPNETEKENQWWQIDKDTDDLYNDYFMFTNM